MDREVKFNIEARNGLKEGIDELANAVKVTLGPKGRIVVYYNKYTGIHATKDGVTIAEEINPDTNIKKMGAEMIREAASKTNELAGDGTTTATVLAQAIVKEGLKNVAAGANPMDLKRGIDIAMIAIISHLQTISQEIGEDIDKIKQVATVSANNDEIIGNLIAKAFAKVGVNGFITVEEAKGTETYVDVVQGLQFDRGYLSPYFVTDTDSMQILYNDIQIILCSDKVTDPEDLTLLKSYSIENNQPVLIICDDMSSEVLADLVVSKLRSKCKVFVIKAPYFGVKRKEAFEDIGKIVGGYVISKDNGYSISEFNSDMIGSAEKCVITNSTTIIINGHGKEVVINKHINSLEKLVEKEKIQQSIERLRERIAILSGGIAVLYAGAASEVEMKEKKDRLDDALAATRAAIEEGIVPGGGVALLRASVVGDYTSCTNLDQITGLNILMEACKSPIRQISENSGLTGDVIISKILENDNLFYGYDFKDDNYCEMVSSGIIDPTKVTRIALENAVSVAGMILMTECALVNIGNQEEGLPDFMK